MSFLDTVRAAAKKGLAPFNTFLLEYKPKSNRIFVFLEGRSDPCFYRRFVQDHLPPNYTLQIVTCGNRQGVLDSIKQFLDRYAPDPCVIAIIDKDHSDLVFGSAIFSYTFAFQTEWYSVENYVCDPIVIRRHCIESLGLQDDETLCTSIEYQYVNSRDRFYEAMKRCMSWIIAARRRGGTVNLANLDVSEFIRLNEDLIPVVTQNDAEIDKYMERTTGGSTHATPISDSEIQSVFAELKTLPPKSWLRGKQELWHIVNFLHRLSPALVIKKMRAGSAVSINISNALEILAPKCDIPLKFKIFLTKSFAEIPVDAVSDKGLG